ncbi:elongator complex protein 2 [Scleropages formosus]|uniref:Elongator complex protein 2 n=1 Tax=Scleropages formosus TaxID=113540 RepID=A0A8C9V2E0_SCLFO|nr:elongator complex protein 2 [Scleropages formosus]
MASPLVQTCYMSCCANRTPNVLSWGRGGLIAFGTCNSVALYEPKAVKVLSVLNGHSDRVNAVRWVHRYDCGPETNLVSGGSDNHVIVWETENGQKPDMFTQRTRCVGHSAPVFAVDAVYVDNENGSQILIASAASDSTVKLWLYNNGQANCLQTLSFGSGFVMDVSLALLPGCRVPILACGGDDCHVHLFVQRDDQFEKVHSLPGHEDWVRGVQWAATDRSIFLASCAQDCLIRIWKVFPKEDASADDGGGGGDTIKMKEDVFEVKPNEDSSIAFAVALETVLAGHENWVYGVHWHPPVVTGGTVCQPMCLLSASMDKTMILWGPEEVSGMWLEQVRVGEVGGNTLGFLGCQMSPDGSMIVAHAFHGALHLWKQHQGDKGKWNPGVVISGHFNAVQDLSWDPEGDFIVSVGSDQTTRLFTLWRRKGCAEVTWHELSRPQIHGYDMQCLTMVGRFQFVSGADEKVLRVFQAPRNFVENFASIVGVPLGDLMASSDVSSLPEGASTPALGLSNKAVFQGDLAHQSQEEEGEFSSVSDQYPESYFHPLTLTEPPPEDDLLQNTLWPEVQKLYGHGFEIFCLASNSARTVVASACKASRAEHAAILLWSTRTWRQLQTLMLHTLTVTQMAFSPDCRFLLAVSRDRTWSLWKQQDSAATDSGASGQEPTFSLCAHTSKDTSVHTRIIWSCDWSHDSKYFVTSSRDKKVIVWGDCSCTAPLGPCSSVLDVGDSCTAVSFCPISCPDGSYLVAAGLECGKIALFKWRPLADMSAGTDWSRCGELDESQSHALSVKRLRWRPKVGRAGHRDEGADGSWVQLASAGADHAVKIFNVNRLAV